jgi:transcriptional regulator with XRE-family HTH domain
VPYTHKVLIHKGFSGEPTTVGEHVFKKRLELGLTQKEVADLFGVSPFTVLNWEKGKSTNIPVALIPKISEFLGYNPEPRPEAPGALIKWKRRALGWSSSEAARRNSVDQSTWLAWEAMDTWPVYPRYRELLESFVAMPNEELKAGIRMVRKAPKRRGGNTKKQIR